jgi:signal transduction histidine kinase
MPIEGEDSLKEVREVSHMDVQGQMRQHPLVIGSALRRPFAGRVAWILAGIEVLLYPLTLYLGLTASGRVAQTLQFGWWGALSPLLAIEFAIVGGLILGRHPGHGVGLVAVAGSLCTSLSAFAGAYAAYSLTSGNSLPAAGLAEWLRGWIWYPGTSLLFIVVPALFPDGRLPSVRWRPILWAVAAGIVVQLVWVSLSQLMFGRQIVDGPYPVAGWLFDLLTLASGVLWILPLFAAVAALAVRFRRSRSVERQQLKWFVAAVSLEATLWAGAFLATLFTHQSPYQTPYFAAALPLALLLLPLAIGVAILRHRLYDIDVVMSRGLAYAGLAAFITIAYLLVVVGVGLVLGTGGQPNLLLSVIAMALVVVLIQPVRARLQRTANRLVYGTPADPYALLAELSKTAAAGNIDRALAQIAEAVARSMGVRRARVRLLLPGGQTRTALWPATQRGPFGKTFPVTYGGDTVGEIAAEESGDERWTEALTQAGHALHTLRLGAELEARLAQLEAQAEELTASRTRLVQAQETERRRLERDLHDGIQQELVVLIAKARLARNQLDRDPASAAETLAELQGSAQHALADLRSLARGIHPAVLSSRGLVEAIDAMAARMPMSVRVDSDQTVRDLRYAPEIEGAAYYVVAEGLANVLKHSDATEAIVTIAANDSWLRLAVADDGHGFDQGAAGESGLRGLRDRVEALGGHLEIDSGPSGTQLNAALPTSNGLHV